MPGSDWTKIIELLYENDGYYSQRSEELDHHDIDEHGANEAALVEGLNRDCQLKGTEDEVRETLGNLVNVNLIRHNVGKSQAEIIFEPDGFEVAHERELTRAQDDTNRYLVLLTSVLVIVQIISIIPNPNSRLGASLIVLFGLVVLVWHIGIFKPAI